jgi:hypothetical protein
MLQRSLVLKGIDTAYRRERGIDRASRAPDPNVPLHGLLVKITAATPLGTAAGDWRWRYAFDSIDIGDAPNYEPTVKTYPTSDYAISISELGNSATNAAFGVDPSGLPTGFEPRQIPIGTPVWVVPYRNTEGTLVWLILNTQAIDGACT